MDLLKIKAGVEKLDKAVFGAIAAFEAIMLLVIVVINSMQTFTRYVVSFPIWWVQDLSLLLFLVNTCLGMGVAWSRNSHLVLDLTENLFPKVVKDILWWLCQLVMFAGGIKVFLLARYNIELYKNMVISLIGYPESVKSLCIGIAALILSFAALLEMIERVLDLRAEKLGLCPTSEAEMTEDGEEK